MITRDRRDGLLETLDTVEQLAGADRRSRGNVTVGTTGTPVTTDEPPTSTTTTTGTPTTSTSTTADSTASSDSTLHPSTTEVTTEPAASCDDGELDR